ncbi:MAG: 50S ribosome-binding GTPase [Verrucomicrobiae bacterium]|nr:50S ribosome-binding GTPase [Verrucomicrobiae bacterium]
MGGCGSCAASGCGTSGARIAGLTRLGLRPGAWDAVVGLAGNPNTGKSTVFNRLTGLRQHTGNWPGKTIARAEGGFGYRGRRYRLIDLPGTYSLLSASPDEEVARDFILFGRPDVVVVVVDATALERNLNLALQVLQITDRVVVCLNLMDEARALGIDVDVDGLAEDLGVPVVACVAREGAGMVALLDAIHGVSVGEVACRPRRLGLSVPGLTEALDRLTAMVAGAFGDLPQARWVALRLLHRDRRITEAVRTGEIARLGAGDGAAIGAGP